MSTNGDPSTTNQEEQKMAVDITNDDGNQDHSTSAIGQDIQQQSVDNQKMTPNALPVVSTDNEQKTVDSNKMASNYLPAVGTNIEQHSDNLNSSSLPIFSKDVQQQSANNDEKNTNEIHKEKSRANEEKRLDVKNKSQEQKGSNQHNAVTATSLVDTTNSKLLRIFTPNQDLAKNSTNSGNSEDEHKLAGKVSSGETLHDESLGDSKDPSKSKIKTLKNLFSRIQEDKERYNVMLTNSQKGGSSIGGKILQANAMDEDKALDKSEAKIIPSDDQAKESVSSSLSNENTLKENYAQVHPKGVALLTQNNPTIDQTKEANAFAAQNVKNVDSQMTYATNGIRGSSEHPSKQYQVLRLTRFKLKELLENSAKLNADGKDKQQQVPFAAPLQDNVKDNYGKENKTPSVGREQPITLILSGPYLDQLENKNDILP
jgi:hypothetical protein